MIDQGHRANPNSGPVSSRASGLRLDLLTTPWFLLCLGVLLLNDFVLKDMFGNWVTGKLSDFAGVPMFALFLTAFLPRHRLAIFVGTAVAFTLWKSPLSQPLIDGWNDLDLFQIARVVDYTDLLALAVLPLAYWLVGRQRSRAAGVRKRTAARLSVAAVASFAIVATGSDLGIHPDETYRFSVDRDLLLEQTRLLRLDYYAWNQNPSQRTLREWYDNGTRLSIPLSPCTGANDLIAKVKFPEIEEMSSVMHLTEIGAHCQTGERPEAKHALQIFEWSVIDKLRVSIEAVKETPALVSLDEDYQFPVDANALAVAVRSLELDAFSNVYDMSSEEVLARYRAAVLLKVTTDLCPEAGAISVTAIVWPFEELSILRIASVRHACTDRELAREEVLDVVEMAVVARLRELIDAR